MRNTGFKSERPYLTFKVTLSDVVLMKPKNIFIVHLLLAIYGKIGKSFRGSNFEFN